MLSEFQVCELTDFSIPENKKAMEEAIKMVEKELGKEYPLIIGGEKIGTEEKFTSINPSKKDQVVGVFSKGTKELVDKAVKTADEAFESWKRVDPVTRARYLFDAASVLRRRRFEYAAWQVFETGKNWVEGDADVAEAIDFLEFYGREMIRLSKEQPLTRLPDEDNDLYYIPLGVGAVIPPWNFPGAIMIGMTTAAVVTGNTVVLKPASTSPTVAYKFMEMLEEIGLPAGVVNFLPGSGAVIGDTLVSHPKTRFIAFTGSKEVGLRINELAAKVSPGQIWIKRTVLEMGGKDTMVIDDKCDIEDAADMVVGSAFGFQGQKCSACSRVIIHKNIYDKFVEMIVERTKKIKVGNSKDPKNYMGPVIDQAAYEKILSYIEIGKSEGELVIGGEKAPGDGYFIEPTIIKDVAPNAKISQDEIFGPVLACFKAEDFDQALDIANNTEFGLTGAVYSKHRDHLEKARADFHVGNLYFNRKCTGAIVDVHPFGGFNMSGTDSKAGSRDYLQLFTQGKATSERRKY